MLNTQDVRRLDNVERAFKSEDDSIYEKEATMIIMKKIEQSIDFNLTSMSEDFIVSENDVQRRIWQLRRHEFELFRRKYVLIE
jgi:hypothetical protein